MRVDLQTGWQGGPSWIDLEADEILLDGDVVGTGMIFTVETPLDIGERGRYPAEVELGTMRLDLTTPSATVRLGVCASEQQARDLARAILDELDGTG